MYHNNILKNQKGVALIVTFFILTIVLAIVLNVSVLLYNEIKIIRNVGNSVVAFYSADSGIEKVLYYDRQQIPPETGRGICNICNTCSDCENCETQGVGDGCTICSSCHITFDSAVDSDQQNPEKKYSEDITVNQQCKISGGTINSYGYYEKVSRAIRIDSVREVSTLVLSPFVKAVTSANGVKMTISVCIGVPSSITIEGVPIVIISGLGDENTSNCGDCGVKPCCEYRELNMSSGGGGCPNDDDENYIVEWNYGIPGNFYTVSIMAYDSTGACIEEQNIDIDYE